jgi:hypothetical protein
MPITEGVDVGTPRGLASDLVNSGIGLRAERQSKHETSGAAGSPHLPG